MWYGFLLIYIIVVAGVLIVGLTKYLEQPENKNKMLVPILWISGPFLLLAFGYYYMST